MIIFSVCFHLYVIALIPVDIVLSLDIKGCELAIIPLYPFLGLTLPDIDVIALLLYTGQPRYLKVQGNGENTSSYPMFDIAKI